MFNGEHLVEMFQRVDINKKWTSVKLRRRNYVFVVYGIITIFVWNFKSWQESSQIAAWSEEMIQPKEGHVGASEKIVESKVFPD